jgi:hypothetical protein
MGQTRISSFERRRNSSNASAVETSACRNEVMKFDSDPIRPHRLSAREPTMRRRPPSRSPSSPYWQPQPAPGDTAAQHRRRFRPDPQRPRLRRRARHAKDKRVGDEREDRAHRAVDRRTSRRPSSTAAADALPDSSTRTRIPGNGAARRCRVNVTTVLDMFTDPTTAADFRARRHCRGRETADFRSAGVLVTSPKGHGTEYGMAIPTITSPGEAQAFVDARIAEGRTTSRSSTTTATRTGSSSPRSTSPR